MQISIRKFTLASAVIMLSSLCGFGREDAREMTFSENCRQHNVFNHLDLGLTLGSTGIGIDLATPITDYLQLRTGVSYLSGLSVPFSFGLTGYSGGVVTNSNFDRVSSFMRDLTGYEMDDDVRVSGKPKMFNYKLMVDVFPFRGNRHWHFTAGFYVGPEKIANAVNVMEEMPTLLTMNIYNRLYNYFTETDFIDTPLYDDIYLDPDVADELKDTFSRYGRMGIHVGNFKDGKPYMMEPDKEGTVKVNAFVNRFRPYVGFGYGGAATKDGRLRVSFDAGVMMWGGSPRLITNDGTDLTRDVSDIGGDVGRTVDLIKTFKVYPVLNFRISYRLF